jgi:hypothetical protein
MLSTCSLALETLLVNGESIVEQVLFLLQVAALETSGDRSARGTASIQHVAAVVVFSSVKQSLDTGLHKAPSTSVERLLLGPDDILGVRVAVQVLLELGPWEGVELLDTGDGGVANALAITVLGKSTVDLTGAHDDTLDLLRLINGGAMGVIRDDPAEVRVTRELFEF